jgi:hypothetical protein
MSKARTVVPAGYGLISLANKDGSLYKKSLLCRTGLFEGMYGSVDVNAEMLQRIADRYNGQRAHPQNENDYAPILTDHIREVDRIKGRVMADLSVEDWVNPETGEVLQGLYGTLRVDNEDAKKKVDDGMYAHLSITFDDEQDYELFEVSFVAVEAARGSIVLKKGETMGVKNGLAALSQRHKALAAAMSESRTKRKTVLAKLIKSKTELLKEAESLATQAKGISLTVKAGQLKTQFADFIKAGKMNPAEMKELDFTELAAMSEKQLKIVLSGYDKRAVSTDVFQYGQEGEAAQADAVKMTPEKMREAISLQKSGKKAPSLAEGEGAATPPAPKKEGEQSESAKAYSMAEEEWKKCMEDISGIHTKLSEVVEKIKGMGADVESLASDDEKEKESQEKLAAEDAEDKALASDDPENNKDKNKEGEQ